MTDQMPGGAHHPSPEEQARPARSRAWVAPTIFLAAIMIPVVILVFSNTESTIVRFAAWEVTAPRWLILAITFFAGALVTRLAGWAWRAMRRRRKKAQAA